MRVASARHWRLVEANIETKYMLFNPPLLHILAMKSFSVERETRPSGDKRTNNLTRVFSQLSHPIRIGQMLNHNAGLASGEKFAPLSQGQL